MESGSLVSRSALAIIVLLGGGSGCADQVDISSTADPLELPGVLPVTTSLSGDTFIASFSGDDADLSFEVDTAGLSSLTTGGGWIPGVVGGRAIFGFVVGFDEDSLRGHLVYLDHDVGVRIRSTV